MNTSTEAWRQTLARILLTGNEVSPRNKRTKEIPQHTVVVDMSKPVMTFAARKLVYRFMAAEAYWILTGDNRVETIAPYNKNISQFSDDGVVFAGAYGPRIQSQYDYVVKKLLEDPDTRQAVMTIWTPNPAPSKDIPCTVAADFKIRDGKLNVHMFMRSSDAWLGLPYDTFNFCMLGAYICGMVNHELPLEKQLGLGTLYLTAASSHLYEEHWQQADLMMREPIPMFDQRPVPEDLYRGQFAGARLLDQLELLRRSQAGNGSRWWEEK